MHQTVREFFMRPDGPVARSYSHLGAQLAHNSISRTCLRYLLFFITNMPIPEPSVPLSVYEEQYLARQYFEACARYINLKPFLSYTLSYLDQHLSCCDPDGDILDKFQLVRRVLIHNGPALRLLGNWYKTTFSPDETDNDKD